MLPPLQADVVLVDARNPQLNGIVVRQLDGLA